MKVFVSEYAAAPPGPSWDRTAEGELIDGLSRSDSPGLELPYYGGGRIHAHDDSWLIGRLRPDWRLILTLLPGTMNRLKEDSAFGLASTDAGGRRRALDFAEEARRVVETLNSALGRAAVAAVEIHSAPRSSGEASPSAAPFAESLSDLRRRDWLGAELLVEHCDAAAPGRAPDKGFLSLDDELQAIELSSGPTAARLAINWGRSAIEARSADAPLRHLRRAREARRLAGLFFSGATPADSNYGAWQDSHAPFSSSCPASLLTPAAAKAALNEAGALTYLGLKIQPLPASLGVPERLAMIRTGLDALAL